MLFALTLALGISTPAYANSPAGSTTQPSTNVAVNKIPGVPDTLAIIPAIDGARTFDSASQWGIHANLQEGDTFAITDGTIILINKNNVPIAEITVNLPANTKVTFNPTTNYLQIVPTMPTTRAGCTDSKWAQWLIRTFGDVFVCTPAALAAMGISAGIASAFVAAGCAGGIEALVTWVSC